MMRRLSGHSKWLVLTHQLQTPKDATMTKLTIVANIHAKEDKIDLVKAELLKLLSITRAEKGCINYDLHQDNENPAHFMFYENWESRALWQDHMNAPHLSAYMLATDGAVAQFTLNEMTEIE
ncbi:Quinol monooxygenase YgiN [Roseibium denhamense]|uniref:Quinol monooxygenase YgiN n=2 Tax=Roseibium denhamense TaxID=76305 RepID=A0ABY1PMC2_9HYPH|nr:Quinol monooxygenase YgiN [Roseibium denhamense]